MIAGCITVTGLASKLISGVIAISSAIPNPTLSLLLALFLTMLCCIVLGMGDGTFDPDSAVTREQMAAILYRYAAFKGIDVSAAADLGSFADFESVSVYARTAIAWASAEGIINGSADGRLMPKAGATRAQVAAILHRYIENCIF